MDECDTNTGLTPLRARAPKGERAFGRAPRNRGKNTTLLASMTTGGMGPCVAVEGATTAKVFDTYVEQVLAPTLSPGQTVVLDNLGAHKGERVHGLIERRGCELVFLPAYSPDFSPIRRGLLQAQGAVAKGEGPHQGGASRGDGAVARRGDGAGREGLVRPLWLRCRSVAMRTAVAWEQLFADLPQRFDRSPDLVFGVGRGDREAQRTAVDRHRGK